MLKSSTVYGPYPWVAWRFLCLNLLRTRFTRVSAYTVNASAKFWMLSATAGCRWWAVNIKRLPYVALSTETHVRMAQIQNLARMHSRISLARVMTNGSYFSDKSSCLSSWWNGRISYDFALQFCCNGSANTTVIFIQSSSSDLKSSLWNVYRQYATSKT